MTSFKSFSLTLLTKIQDGRLVLATYCIPGKVSCLANHKASILHPYLSTKLYDSRRSHRTSSDSSNTLVFVRRKEEGIRCS